MRRSATLDANAILTGISQPAGGPDIDDPVTSSILHAASHLLSQHGLGRWSMDDVANVAGVARATVYRRFTSREELVRVTLGRDLHRFFATVADAVAGVPDLADKVIEGFIVGIREAGATLLPELFRSDTSAAMSLLNSAPVIDLGRNALVRQYETITGRDLDGPGRAEVDVVAEALIRLALSFLLIRSSSVDFDDDTSARAALRRLVRPLLEPPPSGAPPN